MDYSPILRSAFQGLSWFLPLIILIGLFRLPIVKGYFGELAVRLIARLRLDRSLYHRVDNVTLPTQDGTTQIDHLIVSRFGVFVLETKNMKGWIFGSEHQPQWTQKIFKQSFKFQNPLRQNYKHVKALETTLGLPAAYVHSVVVFVGECVFETEMPANVTRGAGYVSYIRSFEALVFTDQQVKDLLSQLESVRFSPTLATHRAHVQSLKSRTDPDAQRICPKCGSSMARRTRRSGGVDAQQFWGCSTFPRCRFTQSLS